MNFEDTAFLFNNGKANRGQARLDFDEAACLWRNVRRLGPSPWRGVEIGRFDGGSTVLLAMAMQSGRLLSIDKAPRNDEPIKKQLADRGLDFAEMVTADSTVYQTEERDYDFAFIDGDHSHEVALQDHLNWGGRVRPGGLIIFHDMAETRKGASRVAGLNTLRAEILQRQCGGGSAASLQLIEEAGSLSVFRRLTDEPFPALNDWRYNPGGLRISKDASVCLVGNGPSATARERGEQIDRFDEVVRFNGYVIPGMERFVGTKATLWCLHAKELPERPVGAPGRPERIIYVRGDNAEPMFSELGPCRIPLKFYDPIRAQVEQRWAWKHGLREKRERRLLPTSGLVAAAWILEVFGVEKIALAGFDHFSKGTDKRHHYWHSHHCRQPAEHDGGVEAEMFGDLVKAGRVEYL